MKEQFILPTTKEYRAIQNKVDRKKPLSLCSVGVSFADPDYYAASFFRTTVELVYVIAGKGTVICNDKKFFVKAGDIFYLPHGCSFEQIADKNDPWTKVWINAFGSLVPNLMMLYNLEEFVHFPNTSRYEFFKKILKVCRNKSITLDEKETAVSLLIHELIMSLQALPINDKLSSTSKLNDIQTIKAYLDNNFRDNIKMSDLTALIYKSESQTIRAFKKAYGVTPCNYMMNMRITTAQKLLADTNLSVKEIAFRVGFRDEHHFSHLFKRKTGKSPSEYRGKQ